MDVRIRGRKVAGDLWEARARGAVAALAVALAAICLRLQTLDPAVAAGVVLLALIVAGQAVAPLGRERGEEGPILRILGASDRVPLIFALVEGGALGALGGVAGAILALLFGPLLILVGLRLSTDAKASALLLWLVAAGTSGALSAGLSVRGSLRDERLAATRRA